MCGAKNLNGLPVERFVNPKTLEHAHEMLRQQQRYVDWTVGKTVIDRANLFFINGDPFATALGVSLSTLSEMKTIRNRIAHSSKKTEMDFRNLVRQKIGYNPKGMVVGKFLMTKIPSTSQNIILEQYGNVLLAAGKIIVP